MSFFSFLCPNRHIIHKHPRRPLFCFSRILRSYRNVRQFFFLVNEMLKYSFLIYQAHWKWHPSSCTPRTLHKQRVRSFDRGSRLPNISLHPCVIYTMHSEDARQKGKGDDTLVYPSMHVPAAFYPLRHHWECCSPWTRRPRWN
jgi:hypothetical protein